jgi:hypothetical protein
MEGIINQWPISVENKERPCGLHALQVLLCFWRDKLELGRH